MEIPPKDVPTALIHLYRGELGRMTLYRARLDTTTNWAVGTSAALTSFALGQERVPHFVFLLVVFLDLIFLWMETRRFRFYELVRMRVRLLETGFYAAVLGKQERTGWEDALWASLEHPVAPISTLQGASVRLRRNYLWLLVAVYMGWLLKLWLEGGSMLQAASVGPLPGSLVLIGAALLLAGMVLVATVYRLVEEE
ncbi:MAG TPA: DUF2270 domain-containing protein [Candidatus Nanopelagicales bacterium]|nr:DUF2270 domain-containing protein [Candidatus Nanopelagicales bacterium]